MVGRTGVVALNVDPLFEAEDETLFEDESPEETLLDGEAVEEALLGDIVVVALLNETPGEDANVTTRGGTMSSIPGSSRTSGFLEIVEASGWTNGNGFFSSASFFSASVFSLISSFFFFSLTTWDCLLAYLVLGLLSKDIVLLALVLPATAFWNSVLPLYLNLDPIRKKFCLALGPFTGARRRKKE